MSETFTGWRTPRTLFDPLNARVKFAVDAAADETNALVHPYYGPGSDDPDALTIPRWLSPAWCNPPYGRGIEKWLEKFIEQGELGVQILALLPARVETQWWAKLVVPHSDIIFLTGRVPFERACSGCGLHTAIFVTQEKPLHYLCAPCAAAYEEDGHALKPYHTQPDHASALLCYGGLTSGRVSWVDWRSYWEVKQLAAQAA